MTEQKRKLKGLRKLVVITLSICLLLALASCGKGSESQTESTEDEKTEDELSYEYTSYTPTPDFWERFDKEGITEEMKAESVHHGENDAQYLEAYPLLEDTGEGFDFFSVEFYTENMPDYTYWALANWYMNQNGIRERDDYTEDNTAGAYAGLQDVGDHTTKIMSIWETYYKKADGTEFTLVPKCVYPADASVYFDHEGNGTSLVAPFEWEEGKWYRFVLRSWQLDDTTYVGTWLEDLSSGEVSLLAVYDTLLPDSYLDSVPTQFLENFYEETYGEYRQMKLRNFCIRGVDSQKWYFPETIRMSIWYDLGYNQGSFRYSAEGDTIMGETCGLGEDACAGLSEDEIIKDFAIRPATEAPDPDRYEIPTF